MERQFTTTVFIVEDDRVLLIWHRKIGKWMPPGGHLEPNETPPECAIRETEEETGLIVELISKQNFEIKHPKVKTLPLPYLMQLEASLGDPYHQHQHIDCMYLGKICGGEQREGRWFSSEEISCEKEILPDVKELALHLIEESKVYSTDFQITT